MSRHGREIVVAGEPLGHRIHAQPTDIVGMEAAQAIAEIVTDEELSPDYIVPSVFNRTVATEVAHAVSRAARNTGVARRIPKGVDIYR